MAKKTLPVYTIDTLNEAPVTQKDFLADHFEHYLNEHKNLRFPHKHSFYQLVYFSKGSGAHSIDFINFKVEPGHIYFMIPGQVHSWHFQSQPDGYIVNFSGQYLHALVADERFLDQFGFFSGTADEQAVVIAKENRQSVEAVLQTIVQEGNSASRYKDDFVRAALVQLFILIDRQTIEKKAGDRSNYNSALLRTFKKLIDLHYKEKRLPREYAEMLHVTPNHLNSLSKHLTGSPAGVLIRDRIILEAKRLLVNAKMNITEIASELDFADNSYFSKFFKKTVGVTPEIFRKEIIKK